MSPPEKPLVCVGTVAAMLLLATPIAARAAEGVSCSLSVTSLAFGKYVPFSGAPADFTATITVACSATGQAAASIRGTVSLAGATGPSGRELSGGSHRLRYQLYLDPARTVSWGDGNGGSGTGTVSGTVGQGTPFRQTLTVYGRLLARQSNASVGQYTDQIAVVLNY